MAMAASMALRITATSELLRGWGVFRYSGKQRALGAHPHGQGAL